MLAPWKKSYDQVRQHIKKQRHYFASKDCLVKAMVFPVVMYGCESWTIKKAERQRIDAFELWCWRRLLRVSRTARRIKLVNPKGNQSWIFVGRTDAEAPIFWSPDAKSWLTGKELTHFPDAGEEGRLKEKGVADGEMVRQHHWFSEHESEQTPGDSEGQRNLAGCIQSTVSQRVRHNLAAEQHKHWQPPTLGALLPP